MQVLLDGDLRGEAVLVRVSHKSTQYSSVPQVAIFYSSGFLRLKPNADPSPPIPFGSSFVLGPAYWPDESTYHHNPQLNRLEIDTSKLPNGPLQMRAEGSNGVFEVAYKMALPPPRDRQTRLHVIQSYRATAATPIDQ